MVREIALWMLDVRCQVLDDVDVSANVCRPAPNIRRQGLPDRRD